MWLSSSLDDMKVEKEMTRLVLENQIQARIDSHNKVVYAKDVDPRSSTFEKCVQIGDEFEKKTKVMRNILLKCWMKKPEFYNR